MSRRTFISVAMTAGCVVSPLVGQTRAPSSAPPSKPSRPVESVKTGLGEIRAFKLMPELSSGDAAPARRLTLWVSEDHRRLPVRMQAELAMGSFDLTLRSTNR